jgi:hypothetical protein
VSTNASTHKKEVVMQRRVPFIVLSLAVLLAAGSSLAYAQDEVTAEIPFKFMAANRTFEAGTYDLQVSEDRNDVTLVTPQRTSDFMPVLTRLAAPETPLSDGKLVFDRVGDSYYLSEVWLPGMDGFLIRATKEKHTHHVIKLQKKAKK